MNQFPNLWLTHMLNIFPSSSPRQDQVGSPQEAFWVMVPMIPGEELCCQLLERSLTQSKMLTGVTRPQYAPQNICECILIIPVHLAAGTWGPHHSTRHLYICPKWQVDPHQRWEDLPWTWEAHPWLISAPWWVTPEVPWWWNHEDPPWKPEVAPSDVMSPSAPGKS